MPHNSIDSVPLMVERITQAEALDEIAAEWMDLWLRCPTATPFRGAVDQPTFCRRLFRRSAETAASAESFQPRVSVEISSARSAA